MAHPRGPALATLPEVLHPEQRITIKQACLLKGWGRSKFYEKVKSGDFPVELERDGRTIRLRAGSVLATMTGGGK